MWGGWHAADMPPRDAHLAGLGLVPVLLGKKGDKSRKGCLYPLQSPRGPTAPQFPGRRHRFLSH